MVAPHKIAATLIASQLAFAASQCATSFSALSDPVFRVRQVVTKEAMGARCAVAADLDGDGDMDIVSASSTDNTVAWYEQLPGGQWSVKKQVTYMSNGARIVATGDIDKDGKVDILVASYYDHTVGWFKNDGKGNFASISKITETALNAQGVTVADIDNDGDLDVISASSGDNTIAWYRNLGEHGRFCEVKNIVDTSAVGARTVVAADLDGDGHIDLASASKDDNTIAWYPNREGNGSFPTKNVIDGHAKGAYSLVAVDLDKDGWMDLVTASNADDTIAFYRNMDGKANFKRYVVYDKADFVLSVFAGDFDGDGDVDIASASYFDGTVRWYENLNSLGTAWQNHTVYSQESAQAHYIFGSDIDGDGDLDLVAITKAENTAAVYYASTACDNSTAAPRSQCCRTGQQWNGSICTACEAGKYGDRSSATPRCIDCPVSCPRYAPMLPYLPDTCYASSLCKSPSAEMAQCDCPQDTYLDSATDTCTACPAGHVKAATGVRNLSDSRRTWPGFNKSLCVLHTPPIPTCNLGHYYNTTIDQCQMCPGGSSSTGQGATTCTSCRAGYFCPPGASFQEPCTPGNFSGPGASKCTQAPAGTQVSLPATAIPLPCEPGTFAQEPGMTQCQSCQRGFFADTNLTLQIGAKTCTPCPAGTTTVNVGSRKLLECFCKKGTHHDCRGTSCRVGVTSPTVEGFCQRCPMGAVCEGPPENPTAMRSGSIQEGYLHTSPHVVKGYMAIESRVFKCGGFGEACPGSFLYRPTGVMCAEGGSDIGCSYCPEGKLYDGSLCIECTEAGVILPIVLSVLAVVALAVLTVLTFPPEPHGTVTMTSINRFMKSMVVSSTVASFLAVLQGTWAFGTLGLQWPRAVTSVFDATSSVLDLSAFRLACTTSPEGWALGSTVSANLLPAAIFGFLGILAYCGKFATPGARRWPSTQIAISQILKLFSTFFLMIVTGAVGRGFSLITHPDGSTSLRRFPYVHDSTSNFIAIQAVSAAGVVVWCVGGMAVVLFLLYTLPSRHGDIGFRLCTLGMVIRFRPTTPWWYVVMMLNSMLIGLAGTVAELPETQSLYLCAVFVVYLTALLSVRPFRCEICHYAEVAATAGQLMTLLVGQYYDISQKHAFLVTVALYTTMSVSILLVLYASWQVLSFFKKGAENAEEVLKHTGIKIFHRLPQTGYLSELGTGSIEDIEHPAAEHKPCHVVNALAAAGQEDWQSVKKENEKLKAENRRLAEMTDKLRKGGFASDYEHELEMRMDEFEVAMSEERHHSATTASNIFNGRQSMIGNPKKG